MASPHLSAQFISRGSGHSAVAKAAYNARAELTADREGETYDYSRHRSKCIFEGIYAPKNAPDWAHDRSQLWNHVEAFEKHRRAELAQEVNIALPHELTPEQNRWLLQDWIKENVTRKGLIADAAIHAPDPRGDARNIHAHVMIVRRRLDGSEFVRAKERFDTFSEKQAAKEADLSKMRESWETLANKHLERHGHEARIDMGRKRDLEPTIHLGKTASRLERQGIATDRGDHNREVDAANENQAREWIAAREREGQAEARYRAEQEAEAAHHREVLSAISEIDLTTQREGQAEARYRAEQEAEAENTPQHRQARPRQVDAGSLAAEPAKAPPERDRNAGDIARALELLALTDPMRFAAAASAAREMSYRPVIPGYAPPSPALPLEIEPARSRVAEPTPAAPKPIQTVQLGKAVSFTIPGRVEPAQEPAREPQAARPVSRGTDLPAKVPEATQRPSYEVENPDRTPERERTREKPASGPVKPLWHKVAVEAGRSMLGQLGDRLDQGIETWRSRRQAKPERPQRERKEPTLAPVTPDRARKPRPDLALDTQHVQHRPGPTPRLGRVQQPTSSNSRAVAPRPVQRLNEHPAFRSEDYQRQAEADRRSRSEAEQKQRQADRLAEWQKQADLKNAMREIDQQARGFWDRYDDIGRQEMQDRGQDDENTQDRDHDGSRDRGGPRF